MRISLLFTIVLTVTSFITGCASVTPSTGEYSAPSSTVPIKNEIIIEEPFEKVWNRLVRDLSNSFFVINNIDRESRLINLSFNSQNPVEYIDCGNSNRTFEFDGSVENFSYPVAGNNTYKLMSTWNPPMNQPEVYEVQRNSSLEGRINVYLAPISSEKTEMSVNVRYMYSVTVSGKMTRYSAFGAAGYSERIPTETYNGPSFNTGQTGTTQDSQGSTTCVATGELEARILEMSNVK
jgi:hypothetical protein